MSTIYNILDFAARAEGAAERGPFMRRYELTDAQWEKIAPFFPDRYHHGGPGPPWKDHRSVVNGILWRLHTGAPWPDIPERYGPWKTVYDRFSRWRQDGTWAKILDALLLRLDKAGFIDRDLWLVDASVIRATRAAAGAKKKSGHATDVGRACVAANAGAAGPCVRSLPRGLRHQGSPRLRWLRHYAGGLGHCWSAS
jgi:transposase